MGVNVGDAAPDFELKDEHGSVVRLSEFRGQKNVVVLFFPGAFTRTCSGELCTLRENLAEYHNEHAQLLAISVDPVPALRRWGQEERFGFPLLSDFWPHGRVAASYGVFDATVGKALRGTFIVDRHGFVRWKVVNASQDPRDARAYARVLAELSPV